MHYMYVGSMSTVSVCIALCAYREPGLTEALNFIAVDCGELSSPDNGEVDVTEGTRLNAVATYSCLLGYRLDGVEERTCGPDGQWSDSVPACVGEYCLTDLYIKCVKTFKLHSNSINHLCTMHT